MAENKPIEVRYYKPAPDDAVVFNRIWGLVNLSDQTAVTYDVSEAYLSISQDGRRKLLLSLGSGLAWNEIDKAVHILIRNGQAAFIREDTDMEYSFWVVWSHGGTDTIREGTVTAVRVD